MMADRESPEFGANEHHYLPAYRVDVCATAAAALAHIGGAVPTITLMASALTSDGDTTATPVRLTTDEAGHVHADCCTDGLALALLKRWTVDRFELLIGLPQHSTRDADSASAIVERLSVTTGRAWVVVHHERSADIEWISSTPGWW